MALSGLARMKCLPTNYGACKFGPCRCHSGQPAASFPISAIDGTANVFENAPSAKTAKTDLADYQFASLLELLNSTRNRIGCS